MAKKEKILCFAPFGFWHLHALYEIAICYNLQWRGHSFSYVTCDGLFSDCDMFWEATMGPRPANACAVCQSRVATLLKSCLIPSKGLGTYKPLGADEAARTFSRNLADAALLDAVYDGYPIGKWVSSSVHTHLRINTIDLRNAKHCATFRSYIYSGAIAIDCIKRMLDDIRPTILLLFNGRLSATRVAMELAMERGIRVVCHERGVGKETLLLWENENCLALSPFARIWKEWGKTPLRKSEVPKVTQWLADRACGANLNWNAFSVHGSLGSIGAFLEANKGKRIWCLFTSSTDEIVACPDYTSVFGTQCRWIEETVAFVRENPAVALVIRVHPNSGGKNSTGRNQDELDYFQRLRSSLPSNVALVMPDDNVSTYSLIDRTDLGLAYCSTVAIEMACRGIRVLVAARSTWMYCGSIELLTEAESYPSLLASCAAKAPDTDEETENRVIGAYRFAYAYMHRWHIPFPLVRMPNVHSGVLAAKTLDELKPGRHACLDYTSEVVLGTRPSVPVSTGPVPNGAYREEIEAVRNALRALAAGAARESRHMALQSVG
jgi:hypothetical protein